MRGKSAAALLWVLGSMACGGGPTPESPADAPAAQETPVEVTEAAREGGADDRVAAPAAAEDVNAVLQLVIDDPELDAHLRLGEPGRFPLKIAGDELPSGLALVKATEPVKLSEPPKSKSDAVLVITALDISADKATVRYRYDVEGIRGTVTLEKTPHGWELKNSRLVEH